MTIVVTGGRDYNKIVLIFLRLDEIHRLTPISLLIEGGADGMDTHSRSWAMINKVKHITEKAAWSQLGAKAGPVRNQAMIDKYKPELCVASPGGKGTADMRRRCEAAGIKIEEVEQGDPIDDTPQPSKDMSKVQGL